MSETTAYSSTAANGRNDFTNREHLITLDHVISGHTGTVAVMICRQWKVTYPPGNHTIQVFIASDCKGNVIQMIAKRPHGHQPQLTLTDGNIYTIQNYTLMPAYHLLATWNIDTHNIKLGVDVIITEQNGPSEGFTRYPFRLTPLEAVHTSYEARRFDVMGFVENLNHTKQTLLSDEALRFELINDRGFQVNTVVRGHLCSYMLAKHATQPRSLAVILTGMTAKDYDGQVYLASTHATAIYTSAEIPCVATFEKRKRSNNVPKALSSTDQSLTQALYMGRAHRSEGNKESATINCLVMIKSLRPDKPLYYFTCGTCQSTSNVNEVGGLIWCHCCESICEDAIPRVRLHFDVSDKLTTVTVVIADNLAEILLGKPASTIVNEAQASYESGIIPTAVKDLINTVHVMELKTHTYYDHGGYESFVCSAVLDPHASPRLGVVSFTEKDIVSPPAVNIPNLLHTPTNPTKRMRTSDEGTSKMMLLTPAKNSTIARKVIYISSDED